MPNRGALALARLRKPKAAAPSTSALATMTRVVAKYSSVRHGASSAMPTAASSTVGSTADSGSGSGGGAEATMFIAAEVTVADDQRIGFAADAARNARN